jgi:hypothetical protein
MKKSMSSIYSFLNKEDTYTKLNTLKEKYPNATIIVKKINKELYTIFADKTYFSYLKKEILGKNIAELYLTHDRNCNTIKKEYEKKLLEEEKAFEIRKNNYIKYTYEILYPNL